MSKKACTKCGGTYRKEEGERVCMQCGNRPDNKPFPDVAEEIILAGGKKPPTAHGKTRPYKKRGTRTPGKPIDLTEDERIAIVNEARERGWGLVAAEREITPNTIYNWRNNLDRFGATRVRGLKYQQLEAPGLHSMIVNLLKELPALDSKPSQASLDGFTRAFGGILMIIYLKED